MSDPLTQQPAGWLFSPNYRFFLKRPLYSPSGQPLGTRTYNLTTLRSCQAMLLTDGGVGQLEATFADPGQRLRGVVLDPSQGEGDVPTPHPMHVVQLWLQNRYGQWGIAWTGYVDECHYVMDPQAGESLQLVCTSAYKRWEITHVSPSDEQTLALAYTQNVRASSIVQLSAQAVGHPLHMLLVDNNADGGSGYDGSMVQTAFTSPDETTWSAIIQPLIQNTGTEFFADAQGRMLWRRVGFLADAWGRPANYQPRPVNLSDILHMDLAESDREVVTQIEVRWSSQPTTLGAKLWTAPAVMQQALGTRRVPIYAAWITGDGGPAAQNLANMLGLLYSANVLQGSVTIPADPLYGVGTLARVPLLYAQDPRLSSDYYVPSVAYQLEWGGPWTMTLGLRYGRSPEASFPYLGTVRTYPTPTTRTSGTSMVALSDLTALSFDATQPAQVAQTFSIVRDDALSATDTVRVDGARIPPGSTLQVDDPATGRPLGPAPLGEYRAVTGQNGFVLGMKGTTAARARVRLLTIGQLQDAASTGEPTWGTVAGHAPDLTTQGTGGAPQGSTSTQRPVAEAGAQMPGTGALAQRALQAVLPLAGACYRDGAFGQDGCYDCSGLVYWAYHIVDQGAYQAAHPDWRDSGPNGEFYFFLGHGAREIRVEDARPGDLLFCWSDPALLSGNNYAKGQAGFGHVGFLYSTATATKGAVTFNAMNPQQGVGYAPVQGFLAFSGSYFTRALDMSGVTLQS